MPILTIDGVAKMMIARARRAKGARKAETPPFRVGVPRACRRQQDGGLNATGGNPCYDRLMTTLEEIEKAIAELPAEDLAELRAWFEALESNRFDEKIEQDAEAGKLDPLAEAALADFRARRARRLCRPGMQNAQRPSW